MNEDNKPISILIDDFKQNLIETVNNSQLPPCITQPIIRELYEEVAAAARDQLNKDIDNYYGNKEVNENGNDN